MTQGDTKIAHTATAGDGGERVRHVKRGTEYEVLGEAEAQVSYDRIGSAQRVGRPLWDENRLTVYRCETTGKLWCRFTDEFRDGRFEKITASPTPTDAQPKAARPVGDEALAVPKGWKIVPDYMTDDMVFAVNGVRRDSVGYATRAYMARHDYNKALAAAPSTALASHPTTGQETVATPREGGVREALVHLRKQAQECREEARKNLDQNHIPQHDWYIARAEALEEAANDVERSLSAPGSTGPGEAPALLPKDETGALFMYESARQWLRNNAPHLLAAPSPAQEPGTGDTGAKERARKRIQALGAAMSRRDWGAAESAYEAIRDAHDRPDIYDAPLRTTPATTAETRGLAEGAR